ncbi:MAG: hypothetical protein J7M25_11290 [Deltaproteobacteria bacterium]|nr:hypothetical protein [Deltaproteobacteria bacterium]
MRKYDRPERARILARTIASDILLYNRAMVEQGVKDDNLFDVLADKITDSKSEYKRRVTDEIFEQYNLFELALVDKLLRALATVPSDIW